MPVFFRDTGRFKYQFLQKENTYTCRLIKLYDGFFFEPGCIAAIRHPCALLYGLLITQHCTASFTNAKTIRGKYIFCIQALIELVLPPYTQVQI